MRKNQQPDDYESLRGPGPSKSPDNADDWNFGPTKLDRHTDTPPAVSTAATRPSVVIQRSGHALSYAGLMLFTLVTYFRPQDLLGAPTLKLALYAALVMLAVYLPSQLARCNNLTAPFREVKLLLLLAVLALLSVPFGISPPDALTSFWDFSKAIIVFIVIVNVVFTETRLKGMFLAAMAVTCTLAIGALNDYRLGNLTVEGYRVTGIISGGMFENPNDLGIHLATMFPLALALALASRHLSTKLIYFICTLLCLSASVVTFSRGNFLGLLGGSLVLAWKLSRRRRVLVFFAFLMAAIAFVVLSPASYWVRVASIFDSSLDAFGSSTMRGELLKQSFWVTLRHPLIGVGIGNFPLMSLRSLVSHNSYTQVGAELGAFALLIYAMFIVAPLRRLILIERETRKNSERNWFYFLSVGLQASLAAYMVSSFFASVAFYWFIYYLVGYAVSFRLIYESKFGAPQLHALPIDQRTEEVPNSPTVVSHA
jgi:O-antigen ligase